MFLQRKFQALKRLSVLSYHLISVDFSSKSNVIHFAKLAKRNVCFLSPTPYSSHLPTVNFVDQRCHISTAQILLRKKKSFKKTLDDDDDEDEEEDENEIVFGDQKNAKVVHATSTRVDLMLKSAFNFPRKTLDTAFYEGRLILNGKKLQKKNQIMKLGDEADFVHEVSPDSPKYLIVSRIELLSVETANEDKLEDGIRIKLLRFKNTKVNNYNPPWKHSGPIES